jgi:lipopolysaccharide/colanic/teichoic acid biosynthesis glycosyltransferase
MQAAAVSQTLDLTPTTSRNRREAYRGPSPEIAWELKVVPNSDVSVQAPERQEVMPKERSEAVSRVVNVAVAATALLLLLPVIVVIGLLIKLTSKGPIFYTQTRVGLDRRYRNARLDDRRRVDQGGRPFQMYKFRSMWVDAEANGQAVWAQKRDPRVTLIGRLLRCTRLDELPQLYNVIRGDMNIVGPRPERPSIFAELRKEIPQYAVRQRVKPGITGWAQINQPYDACIDDVRQKVRLDLEYLQRQGMVEDLRIMSLTLPVMLFRKGGW